ncbi:cytochrome o ubiquinol oxidase subunit II [Sphingomonas sp. MM-1]|uniref:ubiquinol oxidase subunit II n=1 Tax=Sphingomonas sp. MM-1 TaxID=745310 RepID=UPI0002C1268F|nr:MULTISPECIES: ubiquinol oxidase subunit II [unclassified Sphingomonas]AGH49546.1 cytochrome o ubiquinol oxidase subunit II [Sphingomonas sp. MM-1]MDX3885644.1 ubiquinol oxidase subunit II [Sphingomonas sp.]
MNQPALFPARAMRAARSGALIGAVVALGALLGGCNAVVLDPAGDVAKQQANLVVISTVLMLLIIVPVMALTVLFAWRYRQSNKEARYEPEWDHSTQLELLIWAAPLLIIICLGAITWTSTHLLDPYRPVSRVAKDQPVPADARPLEVEVVALDWKWLFIYPEYGIATVNELAAPVDRPINFRITSSSVMNSFYIPALAGQIYAMPGMETKLHAVLNKAGNYEGFSANYSGAGFSGMRFRFHGLDDAGFAAWVAKARAEKDRLDRKAYLELERPSENVPVRRFAAVDADLYDAVVNMCVEPGKMCMSEMMAIDAKGGLGKEGIRNVRQLTYDKHARRGAVLAPQPMMVGAVCAPPQPVKQAAAERPAPTGAPLTGAGLPRPGVIGGPPRASADAVVPRANNS